MVETLPAVNLPSGAPTDAAGAVRFVTCRIGGRLYGIPLADAGEKVVLNSITPIAFAPALVLGAVNRNGRMATVIDARAALGLPPAPPSKIKIGLSIENDGHLYILVVDEVGEIAAPQGGRETIAPLDVGAIVGG